MKSVTDLPKKILDFRMYDAIPSKEKPTQVGETDPEMENFLPLLRDYLKSER